MTLRKLANNLETAAMMIQAESAISAPTHQYFGVEEVKKEVEARIEQLKKVEQRRR